MASPTVEDISTELEQLRQQIAADERELIAQDSSAKDRLELLREPYARRNFLENELKAHRMFPFGFAFRSFSHRSLLSFALYLFCASRLFLIGVQWSVRTEMPLVGMARLAPTQVWWSLLQ